MLTESCDLFCDNRHAFMSFVTSSSCNSTKRGTVIADMRSQVQEHDFSYVSLLDFVFVIIAGSSSYIHEH